MVGSYSCSEWLPTVSSDRLDKEVSGKTVVRTSYDGTIWRQSETVFTAKAPRRRERKEQKNLEEQGVFALQKVARLRAIPQGS